MATHVILNPAAGRGKAGKLLEPLSRLLETELPGSHLHVTAYAGNAREIAATFKSGDHLVVAVGGDGTIHEVVNGIAGGSAKLGIIPVGTGNDFARMFHLPKNPAEAVQILKAGFLKTIDLGKVNDTYFLNGMGIGFDADVVVESQKIRYLDGFSLYLSAVFRKILSYQNYAIDLGKDGATEHRDIFLLSVGNGQFLGGGFRLLPKADLSDGLLDVCMLHALRRSEIFRHLPKAINGTHLGISQVEYYNIRKLVIDCETGIPAHVDGELLGTRLRHLEIEVVPSILNVVCPAPA